jgi:hypothetical protein
VQRRYVASNPDLSRVTKPETSHNYHFRSNFCHPEIICSDQIV